MQTIEYLNLMVSRVRDGYDTRPADRRKLYLFLKVNESWRRPYMRKRIGADKYDWLVGLVEHGDANGWHDQAMIEAERRLRSEGRLR